MTSDIPQTIKEGQTLETQASTDGADGKASGKTSLADIAITAKFIGKVAVATGGAAAAAGAGGTTSRRDSTSSKVERKTSTESEVSQGVVTDQPSE